MGSTLGESGVGEVIGDPGIRVGRNCISCAARVGVGPGRLGGAPARSPSWVAVAVLVYIARGMVGRASSGVAVSVISPGSRAQAEQDLKQHFGVSKVIMVEGIPQGDLTRGHIDGFARFIDAETVVVSQCTRHSRCKPGDSATGSIYDKAADTIEAAGFRVIRDPILGQASFKGVSFDTNYLNWLVGNGFVIAVGFDNAETDTAAKQRIESYFPGREVFIVEMLESWYEGGGVHCHTNDQPAL